MISFVVSNAFFASTPICALEPENGYMTPLATSAVSARAASGIMAAVAAAPSTTSRRVTPIPYPPYVFGPTDAAVGLDGKASKSGKVCPLKHSQLLVLQVRHQH